MSVCCESVFIVYMTGQGICILCSAHNRVS